MVSVWVVAFHSSIALLSLSAMVTLPELSTATPVGLFSPEETRVVSVWVVAFHSLIALWPESAM